MALVKVAAVVVGVLVLVLAVMIVLALALVTVKCQNLLLALEVFLELLAVSHCFVPALPKKSAP